MDSDQIERIMDPAVTIEEENEHDLEGTLALLNDIMESLKRDIKTDGLQMAISLLQEAIDDGTRMEEDRAVLQVHLVKAFLTRFGIFKWMEDLEECAPIVEDTKQFLQTCIANGRNLDGDIDEIQLPNRLIKECRVSVHANHVDLLNTVICVAEEAISSHVDKAPPLQAAHTLLLCGDAIGMKYLASGDVTELDRAMMKFGEAERLCALAHSDGGPLAFISLVAQGFLGLLRFIELGEIAGYGQGFGHVQKAMEMYKEEFSSFTIAVKMLANATDKLHLQSAISSLYRSTSHFPAPHPKRSLALHGLSQALYMRFEREGDLHDLEQRIILLQQILDMQPPPHRSRPLTLNDLAMSLDSRFQRKGDFQDLDRAIVLHQEALDLRPPHHPDRPRSLGNLADTLRIRFEHKGDSEDLEKSILLHQEALNIRALPHPDRSLSLIGLANALSDRFKHNADHRDSERSIMLYQEALDLESPPGADRHYALHSMAVGLCIRFKHRGDPGDLEKSIVYHQEALELRPSPHPHRLKSLLNLGDTLSTRFDYSGDLKDLQKCIVLYREALDSQPPPHPDRYLSLNNLANALSARFRRKGNSQDLNEAIKLHQEVLEWRSHPHPDRHESLTNLGNRLVERYEDQANLEDLERSIILYQEALELQPSPKPSRRASFHNLANAFRLRYTHHENQEDLDKSLHYYECASRYATGPLMLRFTSSQNWASCAQEHRPSSALSAYKYVIELLPLLASLDLSLQQRQNVLTNSREVVGRAAKCAIDAHDLESAVTFMSNGRSIFWSQALQLRSPVEELAAIHPDLAERYLSITKHLNQASHRDGEVRSSSRSSDNPANFTSLSVLADERRQIIEHIRRTQGFEEFLQQPSFTTLQNAAHEGPIILINASELGCDALIMQDAEPVKHIPLTALGSGVLDGLRELMTQALSSQGLRFDTPEARDLIPDCSEASGQDNFRVLLERLWEYVVQPVVNTLGLEKTASPGRIWWCPTGSFARLPVHAAGRYSDKNEPIDCLFQYAVSSYCTSPQDLLHPPSSIPLDFTITAIIEPEAPRTQPLYAVRDELHNIQQRIPDKKHLIVRLGSQSTPNALEDVLHDIGQSSIVHFGCHGSQNVENPLESCLLLSGGTLTMAKIIKECQTSTNATLAYLSACQTATVDQDRPDESLNLTATMMFAGFRSVVGTLWSIMDNDAPIVADVFYGHLFRNGKNSTPDVRDAAYALHLATKRLRESGAPFSSWVPYVHYGI